MQVSRTPHHPSCRRWWAQPVHSSEGAVDDLYALSQHVLVMMHHHSHSPLKLCCVGHSNWRVNGLRLGCGANDVDCPRLQGTLPPALGELSELYILDIQVLNF